MYLADEAGDDPRLAIQERQIQELQDRLSRIEAKSNAARRFYKRPSDRKRDEDPNKAMTAADTYPCLSCTEVSPFTSTVTGTVAESDEDDEYDEEINMLEESKMF